jgi:hypothetical protein
MPVDYELHFFDDSFKNIVTSFLMINGERLDNLENNECHVKGLKT